MSCHVYSSTYTGPALVFHGLSSLLESPIGPHTAQLHRIPRIPGRSDEFRFLPFILETETFRFLLSPLSHPPPLPLSRFQARTFFWNNAEPLNGQGKPIGPNLEPCNDVEAERPAFIRRWRGRRRRWKGKCSWRRFWRVLFPLAYAGTASLSQPSVGASWT